jgi:hypothetical protein
LEGDTTCEPDDEAPFPPLADAYAFDFGGIGIIIETRS